ncbi:sugar O-acetyltransferase [Cellulomonas sp. URHE0023]|uniref:sugar O-acetyltransferase n=1 Tax=Cellulomonas sp. URHE0023 TaxID=1380354 RepID=UPI0004893058|nr:sugar O-acetyltransferase [Cellulomonas sp. URHE0023]
MTDEYDAVRAKLNDGSLYVDYGPGLEALEAERVAGKELTYDFNHSRPGEAALRTEILHRLLASAGDGIWIEPPFHVSYGSHVHIGDGFYANFNLVLVDDADIHIGDRVLIAPNVTISTAGHPTVPEERVGGWQFSRPVRIEDDVWIGANVVILPGVTVGAGSVIGAGSVVTRDIPARVVAVGSPCRVVRSVDEPGR